MKSEEVYALLLSKIKGVASGFDHAEKTGDNKFKLYFTDGTFIELTLPEISESELLELINRVFEENADVLSGVVVSETKPTITPYTKAWINPKGGASVKNYISDVVDEKTSELEFRLDTIEDNVDEDINNLINYSVDMIDGYIKSSGDITSASESSKEKTTDFILITRGMKIAFNIAFPSTVSFWIAYGLYDSNKKAIKRVVVKQESLKEYSTTFTDDMFENATYIRISYRSFGVTTMPIKIYRSVNYLQTDILNTTDTNIVKASRIGCVKSINHRGYNKIAPENTIPAYVLSAKMGFKYVECDVSFTSDNVPVILHDNTVDRTSNGTGNIADMTYAEVSQLDFGSWKSADYVNTKIPTLEEFLQCCRCLGLNAYIEIKDGTSQTNVENIVDWVHKMGMREHVTYISFKKNALGYIKAKDNRARLGLVVNTITSEAITDASALKTDTNDVFINAEYNATDEQIELCISADIPTEVWTPWSEDYMYNANPHISGFTTNELNASDVLYNKYMATH